MVLCATGCGRLCGSRAAPRSRRRRVQLIERGGRRSEGVASISRIPYSPIISPQIATPSFWRFARIPSSDFWEALWFSGLFGHCDLSCTFRVTFGRGGRLSFAKPISVGCCGRLCRDGRYGPTDVVSGERGNLSAGRHYNRNLRRSIHRSTLFVSLSFGAVYVAGVRGFEAPAKTGPSGRVGPACASVTSDGVPVTGGAVFFRRGQ